MSFFSYITIIPLIFQAITGSQQEKCAILDFYHSKETTLSVFENHYVNVTFGMNLSACNQSNTFYKILVHTKTSTDSYEYDGSTTFLKDTCVGTQQTAVRCINSAGPAQLFRKVNRTHVKIQLEWSWKDATFGNFTTMIKELRLNIYYPPRVTRLTIDGHDAGNNHLIDEGQEVKLSCSFDKGNPPADFLLLDENKKEISAVKDEAHLSYSLAVKCKDQWPTIQCEGKASEENKSVSLLVRCRPQFIETYPEVVENATYKRWIFKVKAHTTKIQKCLLSSYSLGGNENKDVLCMMTGNPPELLLSVFAGKQESSKSRHWALSLYNEEGPSDLLVFSLTTNCIPPAEHF